MECTWDAQMMRCGDLLPPELLEIISKGSNEEYLESITRASLDTRYTYTLFAHCGDIFAHVCASLRHFASPSATVATLGRVVPFAPYLEPFATSALSKDPIPFDASSDFEEIIMYLLGIFRLLRSNPRIFKQYVDLVKVQELLRHRIKPVVYLSIRILQICLNGADKWFEDMIHRYLGKDSSESDFNGPWDEKTIDYRFLSLWEDERRESILKLIQAVRMRTQLSEEPIRRISSRYFQSSTALVGNVLFPREISPLTAHERERFITTPTVGRNLFRISSALKSGWPILLTGRSGSGKTTLIRHVAQRLGKLDKMLTLHLNEQSDAKLLVGTYTTGDIPGSFVWKPGVLTTAVQEGRWVLIEDLDKAPNEVMGMLLPLIERGNLFVASRKQTVHAAQGFRLVATVCSAKSVRDKETLPVTHMLGARRWQTVAIESPSSAELMDMASQLSPSLSPLLPQFMAVYDRLQASHYSASLSGKNKTGNIRSITSRDFLKWCRRVFRLLEHQTSFSSGDMDSIFLEAMDCFVGALADGPARLEMAAVVAEELNINPQRRDYLLKERDVPCENEKTKITIGRYTLPRAVQSRTALSRSSFSMNPHASRTLERVAAAVANREPVLLVGETGVGKTTAVQYLAMQLGKTLETFNLSQQSEAGDLLGGFKPVTARTLIIPLKDEFDDLFHATFSMNKNQQFLELLGKQVARNNWTAVCKLWRQALQMVSQQVLLPRSGEAPSKKRKLVNSKSADHARWAAFAGKVEEMEKRLAAGEAAIAFNFIEGNFIKAVRNGHWVLLDEINLASADTLEAIAEILDPAVPSILLTEAGSVERIEAHPDFRIFAAMNPATDIGKKDLPPGIRSRFTEQYVESPDKDIRSLQGIVHTYLRTEISGDSAVTFDVSTLYQKIIGLAEQNKLVDGAGQQPHFSLRTLTRTLSYAKYIAPQCSIRRALYEGCQMSFLTFLDAESAQLVQPLLEQYLLGKRINIRAELKKALRKPTDGFDYIQAYSGSKHWLRKGCAEPEPQPHYILTPFIESNLENLVRASSTRKFPVLIQGPTSSGKTSMIEYLAKRTGHKFVRINNHEHTDLQEYFGTYMSGPDGKLQFQEGVLVRALRDGHWIVLDELNLAPTDVLEALNRLLDDNRELLIPETQELVRPHENFMLFATQNPAGLYGGRKALSRAFRNRFLELHFDDIPIEQLQNILYQRTQLPESRCKRIVAVYRELSVLRQESRLFEQKSFATLRDLFRWAMRPNDTIDQLASNGFMLLAERVRKPEERLELKAVIERVMSAKGPRVIIDENALYAEDTAEIRAYAKKSHHQQIVWTKAMRRLYILVDKAIRNNEPVLLVGETGCGKTTVCEMHAESLGQTLHTLNAHQSTETGDLIGSQRPVRNRGAIEAELRRKVSASEPLKLHEAVAALSTDKLLQSYDQAVLSLDQADQQRYRNSQASIEINDLRVRYKAIFEWVDGSLVQAMKEGAAFLLDEISLADDSVLERINSVLESSRSILLAEKGSSDSFITAAPGFQFFATMNPGGDYGKRELSPALRNRFTEIWVPALSDTEDVMDIVSAELSGTAKQYAEGIVAFAIWFKKRYNTSASPSISIREVLAWVHFVNSFSSVDISAALVHGAAMVYIDTLGANPAGLMNPSDQSIEEERKSCLIELGRLLRIEAASIYHAPVHVVKSSLALSIGPFSIDNRDQDMKWHQDFTFDAQTVRFNGMRVARALQLAKPVMLEGNPGVGKTALITAIADAVGIPLTRINLSEQTDLMDLFGCDAPVDGAATGVFQWRDAPFLTAMKKGDWVLLDEMNLASQSVLEGLNACLDHRGEVFVPELGQTFSKHPSFRLFAAQNPHHQGGGRKGLPASFVNRFNVVYADAFRFDDLLHISQRSFPQLDPKTMQQVIRFVECLDLEVAQLRRYGANGGPWEFNLRDITRWFTLMVSEKGLLRAGNARDFADLLFMKRFRSSADRAFVVHLFESIFGDVPQCSDLFSSISPSVLQLGLATLDRDDLEGYMVKPFALPKTPELFRTVESVMLCVQQKWPVVLVGPSGSGKTSLLENLAAAVGQPLITVAMNSETDAMDLIGGYEQYDPLRQSIQAAESLRIHLTRLVKSHLLEESASSIMGVLATLGSTDAETPLDLKLVTGFSESLSDEMQYTIRPLISIIQQTSTAIEKARFEWIDGVLVEALLQGQWLILDNANLCSPSVLDRLNSLLEHDGTLIMNEHTSTNGSPRIIRPHPNFRIFLTVDPRYGELSRAMRNRAVELYLPLSERNRPLLDPLTIESAMARFHQFKVINKLSDEDGDKRRAILIANDHIALRDEPLIPRLNKQLSAGLYGSVTDTFVRHHALDLALQGAGQSSLAAFYEIAGIEAQMPADFACGQVSTGPFLLM